MGFTEAEIIPFFASLTRVAGLFLVIPIFGDNNIPSLVKIFLAFTINMVVFPVAVSQGLAHVGAASGSDMGIILLAMKEFAVGWIIGFTAKMFFEGLTFAFAHMGSQMGFNMATAYDHHQEANIPVISQMISIFATMLFLALNGHHIFLKALVQSYEAVPIGGIVFNKPMAAYVMETSTQIFWIAAKLSAPMAMMIFLINCAFGIVAKAVPQINVFVVSFSVNILAGFIILAFSMPVFGASVGDVFQKMAERMMNLMGFLT
ncbi:MAG TPA: flagellar biosynthetic protein FliR [Bdellovibrionota bacterium]|jgi:flagellar biosynthetic protein FliR